MADRLVRLGLTQYEARAYLALIRRDGSTPAEVAKVAGVPRQRIYDVIDSLAAKGLVSERPGRAAKFAATPPAEAADLLVAIHRERMQMLEADADAVARALWPAYLEGSTHGDPLDYIELIRSPEAIEKRFTELVRSVEREVLTFTKAPFVVRISENEAGLEAARIQTVRTVYELSVLDDPVNRDGIQRFIAAGEQARFVAELPIKLCIIDERTALLSMADPVAAYSGLTTLVIENAQLAHCLKIAFEQVWRSGVSFATAARRHGARLSR
jgi:HTH-type transcriptional regulator, sugar sensing transcriptional regulator